MLHIIIIQYLLILTNAFIKIRLYFIEHIKIKCKKLNKII